MEQTKKLMMTFKTSADKNISLSIDIQEMILMKLK